MRATEEATTVQRSVPWSHTKAFPRPDSEQTLTSLTQYRHAVLAASVSKKLTRERRDIGVEERDRERFGLTDAAYITARVGQRSSSRDSTDYTPRPMCALLRKSEV
jgi:hypothetical protein